MVIMSFIKSFLEIFNVAHAVSKRPVQGILGILNIYQLNFLVVIKEREEMFRVEPFYSSSQPEIVY